MRPEPARRSTRRRYNERPPICFRPGDLRTELDARCDGTEAGYRAVVMRDLERYYRWLREQLNNDPYMPLEHARNCYHTVCKGEDLDDWPIRILDPIERAHILVTHAGLTVDAALVAVGLVKEAGEG